MFCFQRRVLARFLFALGAALYILPGCSSGSGGSSSIVTSTVARSLTETFEGNNTPNGVYVLEEWVDQTKPFFITANGVPLAQGKDYSIDANFPNVVHVSAGIYPNTSVVVQYTTLATTTQSFPITRADQTAFTLSRPADVTHPILVSTVYVSLGSASDALLSSQDYTVIAGPPTIIRLKHSVTIGLRIQATYVPEAQ